MHIQSKFVKLSLAITLLIGASNQAFAADANVSVGQLASKGDISIIDPVFEQCLLKHFESRFFNRIDATADQRQKLTDILSSRLNATRALREKLRQQFVVLNDMMAADNVAESDFAKQMDVLKAIRGQLSDERLKTALAVRDVLTPDQRRQISSHIRGLITGDWQPAHVIGNLPVGMFLAGAIR